jgi:hypothetical protein
MMNTIQAMLPRLLTGKTDGMSRMLNDVRHWNEKKIVEEFDKIPERYKELYNDDISKFGMLTLYTEIINFFRDQDIQYIALIKEAQKRVILSHNSQFKHESSNSKLSEES